ncbi:MAG: divalent metal cation transporter [Verrucomicrobiota bacterium]|nr:divalent metal cation transporter [Verrucomicrobiota bacterium]
MANIEQQKQFLQKAEASGLLTRLGAYARLSGPGWLQSAITLGGGSLASSLFLGVLAGYSLLWLQPLAILLGVIMLCAISHVTLSTGQSPFVSIKNEINPVLAWGWAIATIMANIVWCLPQFSLGTAAVTQNLFPGFDGTLAKVGVCSVLLLLAIIVIWVSEKGSWGAKAFDSILKVMVGLIVVSFFGVVVKMTLTGELNWGEILPGFAPDLSMLFQPAQVYEQFLTQTGEFSSFWENKIVGAQRDVMIAAAASAVGINMTFFMPFVLLRRKWGREHRGLAKFDLWTALLIPYVVATSCVVIAAGSQFNGKPESAYSDFENKILHPNLEKGFYSLTTARIITEIGASEYDALAPIQQEQLLTDLPEADKQLAAMLVKRDSFNLAASLEGLLGSRVYSHWVFGIGVVGMALSTIIILMTINGHAVCEVLGKPHHGPPFLMGAFVAGIGVLGPFVWSDAAFWLAVPTSIIGFTLIPLAYLSFFLLINNKRVLGRERPEGKARWLWNAFLLLALGIMGSAAFYVAWNKTWGDIPFGRYALIAFGILLVIGDYSLKNRKLSKKVEGLEMRQKRISQQSESAESKT